MKSNPRAQRVADRIQIEIAEIIQRKLKDPRHGFITITGVEVTSDLRSARVFISTLDDAELEPSLATLERARGFIRTELGQRIRLRHTPDLQFRPDRSGERAMRVSKLLRELHEKGELSDSKDPADAQDPADESGETESE
jgi:ribosome-binding factor A